MTEVRTPAGSKVTGPIWPERFLHVIHERDRARDVAVALEQENAELLTALRAVSYGYLAGDVQAARALIERIDRAAEEA